MDLDTNLIFGVAAVVIVVIMVLFAGIVIRVQRKSRLDRRIARITGRQTGKASDKKKAAQKKLLMQGKLDELDPKAKKKQESDQVTMQQRMESAGVAMPLKLYLTIWGVLGIGAFFGIVALEIGTIPGLLAGITVGLGFPRFLLNYKINKRANAFVQGFPDAVDIIVRGVKSGLPLGECMVIIAQESPPPVGEEFRLIIESMRLGLTLGEAMDRAVKRVTMAEFRFFAIVLGIQQETGGNLAETLSNLSEILRARKKMKNKVKAMSSEARTTAMIIGCLPIVMALLLWATAPDYIALLFTTSAGKINIAVGLTSITIGSTIMAKMVNFKI